MMGYYKYRRKYSDVIVTKKGHLEATALFAHFHKIPKTNMRNNFVALKVILFVFDCMFVMNTNTFSKKGF